MKFVFLVEGQTEQQAVPDLLKRWLDRRLKRPVGIQTVRSSGWQDLVKEAPVKARLYLDHPRQGPDIIAVVALLDLYGPTFYPGNCRSAEERYRWGKAHMEKHVGDPRFRQFFAVHETEAWLLSQPEHLPHAVQKALPGKIGRPEQVNFDEPPARLLDRLYREKLRRKYMKVTDGRELFRQLDPEVAHDCCPRLREMLDMLLQMAQERGL